MLKTIVSYVKSFFRTNKGMKKFNEEKLEEQNLEEQKVTHGENIETSSIKMSQREGEKITNLGDKNWDKIISKLSIESVEIQTLKHGLWFHAYHENGFIYVEKSKNNTPSCCISAKRKITEDKFKAVFPYYEEKSTLRKEAVKISQNTAYIYALINYFEKIEN